MALSEVSREKFNADLAMVQEFLLSALPGEPCPLKVEEKHRHPDDPVKYVPYTLIGAIWKMPDGTVLFEQHSPFQPHGKYYADEVAIMRVMCSDVGA